MVLTLRLQVDLMRLFGSAVIPKPFRFSVDGHAGSPFVLKPNDAHKARLVANVGLANVLRIAVGKHIAQIANSVIRFVAVDVINKPSRPFAMRVQPCQTMRFVDTSSDANGDVPNAFFCASGNIASFNSPAGSNLPQKHASPRVIIKRCLKLFCRQSHLKSPVVSMNAITSITGAQA